MQLFLVQIMQHVEKKDFDPALVCCQKQAFGDGATVPGTG
jgi:hypothetical protein